MFEYVVPFSRIVWEGLGSVALLEEAALKFQNPKPFLGHFLPLAGVGGEIGVLSCSCCHALALQ